MKDTGLDPKKSLAPVTKAFELTQVFAVNARLGVKSFDELAALAKAKPKTLVYMAPSLSKVAFMEEFNKKHGVDFVRVPFKGGGDAINTHDDRHDADRDLRHRQPAIQLMEATEGSRLCRRQREALAACARHPDLPGDRLQGSHHPVVLRHLCADRNAQGRSSTR